MKIEKINRWFARRGEWIVKRRWVVIIGFIALFAAGFYGLRFMKINDSWESYFLEDDPVLLFFNGLLAIIYFSPNFLLFTYCTGAPNINLVG